MVLLLILLVLCFLHRAQGDEGPVLVLADAGELGKGQGLHHDFPPVSAVSVWKGNKDSGGLHAELRVVPFILYSSYCQFSVLINLHPHTRVFHPHSVSHFSCPSSFYLLLITYSKTGRSSDKLLTSLFVFCWLSLILALLSIHKPVLNHSTASTKSQRSTHNQLCVRITQENTENISAA